ncbi:hypothetical protein K9N68_23200 [Kovacikia minuta CCNUW1]|uniref:hypothetical protein n=1 Tax=Kovacikia minuta TaxID=2931930 RepID=UPI001CCB78E7|nr:hypothetical protein [Kovacikia minuta]UBF24572.1 hypothetical protein K9N68_23200 [Kovacikia minuta CCNUW1]
MKAFNLTVSALLLLANPAFAVDYQGKNIDGRKLPARVYSFKTGGVYDAQVQFKQNLATIYFANGGQLMLRLNQKRIADPNKILGYGRAGQLPLGRSLGIGLNFDEGLTGSLAIGAGRLDDLWNISLNPSDLEDKGE